MFDAIHADRCYLVPTDSVYEAPQPLVLYQAHHNSKNLCVNYHAHLCFIFFVSSFYSLLDGFHG